MDRRLWTKEEDQHIVRLVNKFGTKKWPTISEKLCAETQFQRTGKQCRQRWYNHLNPEIDNSLWTEQDEDRLFQAHKQYGNKWKVISQLFVGRTDNSIKNHFYSTIRRCLRRINKLQGEKNSTLKMRTIKPYVLSKILADRNLTETILELGKIKPNKSKTKFQSQYFEEFNTMISKLYQINKEYEQVKTNKKQLVDTKLQEHSNNSQSSEDQMEQEDSKSVMAEESVNQKQFKEEENKQLREKNQHFCQNYAQFTQKQPKTLNKRKSILRPSKNNTKTLQEYKQIPIPQSKNSYSQKRNRKSINYMKLNEGILCENERQEMGDETNHQSELSKKKVSILGSEENVSLEQKMFGYQNLQDIIEQQEKSNEKDQLQNRSYSFHNQQVMKNFEISHPSPSYSKNSYNFFEDLIVIGTHLKIFPTPRKSFSGEKLDLEREEKRQNQEEFIEEILEINFDPDFAMRTPQQQGGGSQNMQK